jgi:hypothetical protein
MTDLTLFKSGAQLPDYLRGDTDEFTKRLAGSSGGKTISIKGGVWRMIVGGEEIAKNEDRAMNLVFVNAAPAVARTYYEGSYEEGQSTSPACFSADGKTPDSAIKTPQSNSCATCAQNIAGSGQGESRACRYSQRFAVVLEGDIGGNVFRLQLPAKSLFGKAEGDKMPLQAYAKFLAGHGVPMSGIVTEARFDTAEAVPVLKFRAVRPLTREELAVSRTQGGSDDSTQAIEFKMVQKELPALPASFAKPALEAPAKATRAPVKPPEAAEEEEAPAPTKRATKKVDPPVTATKDVGALLDEWGSDDE